MEKGLGIGGGGEGFFFSVLSLFFVLALSKIIKELITKMLKRGELYMDQRAQR